MSTNNIVMDALAIREYLPHRFPMLLVDRVVELEVGKKIVAYKNISNNEAMFSGHFPNYPVFPGVYIVEAMAQASGLLGFKTMDKKPADGSIYLFVGADDLRFKKPVVPGDQLWLEAEIITAKRGIWKFATCAKVGGEVVCSAIILCADRVPPKNQSEPMR